MSRAQTFGPYVLYERVNVGGMAEVFRAIEKTTKREVAIKRLLPSLADDAEFVSMFRDEASIASQLTHPNVASIRDVGQVDRSLYIAMEYVAGKDARTLFDRAASSKQEIPLDIVIAIIAGAADGLAYAHSRADAKGEPLGVVHRDVSLQNLLVSFDGEIKLIDFGIAKAAGRDARTQAGTIKGKFGYMSPEQVRGLPVDRRTDIFSLGVCFWELLTSQRLFYEASDIAVIEKVRACQISRPSSVQARAIPGEIERIVMKSLAKDVDDRYDSAAELFSDLGAFAHKESTLADRPRVAAWMKTAFSSDSGLTKQSREESRNMADKQGGSDLDVFEGLTKKPTGRPSFPPPGPPPSGPRPLGAPLPPPSGGPPRERPKTMLGLAPPAMGSAPLPPPTAPGRPSGPPPMSRPSGPPPVLPPPSRPSTTGMPLPPPSARGTMPLPHVAAPPSRPPTPGQLGSLPKLAPPPTRSAPPPVVPPPQRVAAPSAPPPVDMDWDDEDEKTSIYDKEETAAAIRSMKPAAGAPPRSGPMSQRNLGAATALAAGSGGAAAPPMALPPPTALPTMPTTIPPSAPIAARAQHADETQLVRQPGSSKAGLFAVIGLVVVAAAAGGYLMLRPTRGTLVVAVKSGGRPLTNVQVFVDDKKICDAAPCRASEIEKGTRTVKAVGVGYDSGSELVAVHAGEESPVTIELAKSRDASDPNAASAAAKVGTGFHVSGPAIIKVSLDGKDIGPLPQDVKDVTPGDHKVKFFASDRYKTDERSITVVENEMKDLGQVKLPVVKGKATLTLETLGATVTLVSGSDRKAVRQFPISVDIDTSKTWVIEATKPGFDDFRQPIAFDDGEAEKTFKIQLSEKGKAVAPKKDDTSTAVAAKDDAPKKDDTKKDDTPKKDKDDTSAAATVKKDKDDSSASKDTAASGNATLSINSIPPSNCILDGRPLGSTPKQGVSVSAGTHTVIFVHPDKGRKTASVTVKAGESRSVGVRF